MAEIEGLVPEAWAEPAQGIEARWEWPSTACLLPEGRAEKGVSLGCGHLAGRGREGHSGGGLGDEYPCLSRLPVPPTG